MADYLKKKKDQKDVEKTQDEKPKIDVAPEKVADTIATAKIIADAAAESKMNEAQKKVDTIVFKVDVITSKIDAINSKV